MEANEIKRERSALYPMMNIDESFDMIQKIDKIGGKIYSKQSIAKSIGMSEKTNSFNARISTLKQYGLISGVSDTYKLADIALSYLYPIEDSQRKECKLAAFLNVPLYKKIVDKYENQALPAEEKLANLLMGKDYGLTKNTKDFAAKTFMECLSQLNILVNGVLILRQDTEIFVSDKESNDNVDALQCLDCNAEFVNEEIKDKAFRENRSEERKDYYFEIPMISGETAKITIPQNISTKDLDFIQMYIENLLPAFLQNIRNDK